MGIKLIATQPEDPTQRVEFQSEKASITIGRSGDNDIVLPGSYVSGSHARIDGGSESYFLIDLKSRNGTRVNGTALLPYTRQEIRPGDCLQLGPWELSVEVSLGNAPQAPPPPPVFPEREAGSTIPQPEQSSFSPPPISPEIVSPTPPPSTPPPMAPESVTPPPVAEAPIDVEGEVVRLHASISETLVSPELIGAPDEQLEGALLGALRSGCGTIPHSQKRGVLQALRDRLAGLPLPDPLVISAVEKAIQEVGDAPAPSHPVHGQLNDFAPPPVPPSPPAFVPPPVAPPESSFPSPPTSPPPPLASGGAGGLEAIAMTCLQTPAPSDPAEAARLGTHAAHALQELAEGFHRCLRGREDFKSQFNAKTTMLVGLDHNPVKDAEAAEDLLRYLLSPQTPVPVEERISNLKKAFEDIQLHQLALVSCIQQAVDHAIKLWDPQEIRREAEEAGLRRPKEIMEHFEQKYATITGNVQKLYNEIIWPNVQQGYIKAISEMRGNAQEK